LEIEHQQTSKEMVTLGYSSSSLLPQFGRQARKRVQQAFEARGVVVHLPLFAKSLRKIGIDTFEVTLFDGKAINETALLLATGSKTNTKVGQS
jgi:pyruvate/2-oxoglutarate dehydrogenase complex dihydrolipoamide dehydrogenase (E3) component